MQKLLLKKTNCNCYCRVNMGCICLVLCTVQCTYYIDRSCDLSLNKQPIYRYVYIKAKHNISSWSKTKIVMLFYHSVPLSYASIQLAQEKGKMNRIAWFQQIGIHVYSTGYVLSVSECAVSSNIFILSNQSIHLFLWVVSAISFFHIKLHFIAICHRLIWLKRI